MQMNVLCTKLVSHVGSRDHHGQPDRVASWKARGYGVNEEGGLCLIPFVLGLTWVYRSVILWLVTWLVRLSLKWFTVIPRSRRSVMSWSRGRETSTLILGYRTVPLPVIWNVRSPGVGLGSLTFPIAESWACQVTETMVPEAGSLVARRAGTSAGLTMVQVVHMHQGL